MNKKLVAIMAVTIVAWSLILTCVGAFGPTVQATMIPICLNLLKWIGILIGYAIAIFLPVRIYNALVLNKTRKQLMELQEEAARKKAAENQEALRQRAVEEAILKAYYKEEDDV